MVIYKVPDAWFLTTKYPGSRQGREKLKQRLLQVDAAAGPSPWPCQVCPTLFGKCEASIVTLIDLCMCERQRVTFHSGVHSPNSHRFGLARPKLGAGNSGTLKWEQEPCSRSHTLLASKVCVRRQWNHDAELGIKLLYGTQAAQLIA